METEPMRSNSQTVISLQKRKGQLWYPFLYFGATDGILVRFATEPLPIYACPSQDGRTRFSPETPAYLSRRDSGDFGFSFIDGLALRGTSVVDCDLR